MSATVSTTPRPGPQPTPGWSWWRVSGPTRPVFEVEGADGLIEVEQVTDTEFVVGTSFRFVGAAALADLRSKLDPHGTDPAGATARIDRARTFLAPDHVGETTDLASVPPFMRWFENSYGRHSLAAVLHDELITDEGPNKGALGSDALSDRFFRTMMGAAGVPLFKRWIMWAAVAMRTRWQADLVRKLELVLWGLCALVGMTAAVAAVAAVGGAELLGGPWWTWALVALLMPLASSPLWGKQYGASLVAAAAGGWLLPAAVFAYFGYLVYSVLERVADTVVRDRT